MQNHFKTNLYLSFFLTRKLKIKGRSHHRTFYLFLLISLISVVHKRSYGKMILAPSDLYQDTVKQQHLVISGVITDEKDQPLPGVSVQLEGTKIGVVANNKGEFMLDIQQLPATLIFNSVGYKKVQLAIHPGMASLKISMQPTNTGLDEVVIVGYGKQKKISVTGSISELPVEEIQRVPTPSLSNAIGGKLPGIITRQSSGEPGYDQAQVFVRGVGTFGGNANPLILVDGVERSMDNINAQEVESFTILKDASATAVYGVRGANGVILITTKRGKVGLPHISFRSEAAQLTALRLPKYINGYEYASLVNEANTHVGTAPQFSEEDLQKYKDGSDPYFHPSVNWADEILKRHTSQDINNLSVSGGNNVIRYYTSIGYTTESGIYKEDNLNAYRTNDLIKRYNFRSNVDINLSKSLSISLGVAGIIQNGHYPGSSAPSIFSALGIISPIQYPITNPDGSAAGGASYLGNNPWALVTQSGYSDQARHTLQSTFSAKWDLSSFVTKGLSLNAKYAYDYYNFSGVNRVKAYAIKQYEGKDPTTGEDIYNIVREEQPLGYAPFTADNNRNYYMEASANYQRTFNKVHDVSGLLLVNQREYTNLVAANSTLGLPYRSRGLAGRATYGYDNRYLAEFDFGYNGSENFPKDKRFGFFPSISAGWIVSNEKFWHVDFINQLKFRGSYGQVGNDQIGGPRFIYLTTITKNANTYWFGNSQQGYPGYDEGQIGNEDVTWETATKKNLGMDLSAWEDKITLQVDVFSEMRKGILMQRQTIPFVTGIFPWIIPYGNLGKVKNKGIDINLKLKNKPSEKGFFYSLSANFTYAHNEVIDNDEPNRLYAYQSGKGHSIGAPYGLIALGLFKDQSEINNSPVQKFSTPYYPGDIKFADVNGDGVVDTYDQVYLDGYPRTPEIMYGFGGTIAWKGFDMSIYFAGTARTSIFTVGPSIFPFQRGAGSYNVLREYYDNRWTPQTPDAKYPAVTPGNNANNFQNSSLYLRDASYLRLKNAEIAYTIPNRLIKKYHIGSLRIFLNGTNLLTFDHLKYMDPESNSGTNNGDYSVLGYYPLQRALNLGLQINFN